MFGRKKKQSANASPSQPDTASRGESADAITNRQSNPNDVALLDSLTQQYELLRDGKQTDSTAAVESIFKLSRWFYPARGEMPNPQPTFINSNHGKSLVIATSGERAHRIAKHFDVKMTDHSDVYTTIQTTPEQCLRIAILNHCSTIHFDLYADGGVFVPVWDLLENYKRATGRLIEDIVVPAAPGEFKRLAEELEGKGLAGLDLQACLIERLLRIPHVLMPQTKDAEGHPVAMVKNEDNKLLVFGFANPYSLNDAFKNSEQSVEVSHFPVPVFIDWSNRLISGLDPNSVFFMLGEEDGLWLQLHLAAIVHVFEQNDRFLKLQQQYHRVPPREASAGNASS
ncbi:MAG: hypothetical protein ACF8Q5_07855 [Phycisphaerales bacterium JB040]